MTKLRLTLFRPRREDEEAYLPMYPDETVASWAKRQPGVSLRSDSQNEGSFHEDTFGQLVIDLPKLPRSLRQELQRAAQPPDKWLLEPGRCSLQCPRCIAEDWSRGVPAYDRRAWYIAWRTCCPRHGPMFDSVNHNDPPTWERLLDGPRWTGRDLRIFGGRPGGVWLELSLGSDRRAVHLEAALAGRRPGSWFPRGMTQTTLRAIYREIVSDLLDQFFLVHGGSEDQRPDPDFNRLQNGKRFAINVLAEAILSEWTNTPLPMSALAQRTSLLVRVIGWGERHPPIVRAGQVLFHASTYRTHSLVRYAALLRPKDYTRLTRPAVDFNVGCLTLPEARLLRLSVSATVTSLAQMVTQGRLLFFDGRRGRFVENPFLPVHERLAPKQVYSPSIVHAGGYRPLPTQAQATMWDSIRQFFGQDSPNMELRGAARQRHRRREERMSVRFNPVARCSDAQPSSEEGRQALPD